MPVTLRQSNVQNTTGLIGATMPAWSIPTVAGNLLVLLVSERQSTLGAWPTKPAGYSQAGTNPFVYSTGTGNPYGMFYKIAAGADATPGTVAESGSTQDWTVISLEFAPPAGQTWFPLATVLDKEVHSAAGAATSTTKVTPTSGTLTQASELVVGQLALDAAWAAFTSWSVSTITDIVTATTFARAGWLEVAATTALTTTATWTTARIAGVRLATFKIAAGVASGRVQGAGSRAVFEEIPSRSQAFMTAFASVRRISSAAGIPFLPPPAPSGAQAFTPKFTPPAVAPTIARMAGQAYIFPPDPSGGEGFTPTPQPPSLRISRSAGIPFVPPPDPAGAATFGVYFTPPPPTPKIAVQAGIPYVPPPDPFGARAFFVPPLLATTTALGMSAGSRAIFPPDPAGAQAFTTFPLIPTRLKFGQSGNGPIFPLEPFGGQAFFTPPLLPTVRSSFSSGSRAVFPADPSGGQVFGVIFKPRPPDVVPSMAAGSPFLGAVELGYTLAFNPHGDFFFVPPSPQTGGGGEWVIWERPDFPGRQLLVWRGFDDPGWQRFPGFEAKTWPNQFPKRFPNPFPSRRTRREKRGY